jgi:integrase
MSASIASVVRSYLAHVDRQVKAGASLDHANNIRRDLARFSAFIGDVSIDDCRQIQLTEWLGANPQWKSVCSQRNAVANVIGCFHFAEEEGLIARCPYRRPRMLRNLPDRVRRPALAAEYLALRRRGSRPLSRALWFLWQTGARTCEMRLALWSDVTWDGECPRIMLVKNKTARKTGKARVIPLTPIVVRVLRLMQKRARSPFIFVNSDGTPWDRRVFARNLRRLAKRLGMDDGAGERVSAYCLRHSYTCAALTAGFTSKQVADQLGHVDSKMVERVYGSHTREDLRYLSRLAGEIQSRRE